MLDKKQLLNVWMNKWDASALHLVELMRLFSREKVSVRIAVLWSLLCAEIVWRLLVLLTRLSLVGAVSYGLTRGIA